MLGFFSSPALFQYLSLWFSCLLPLTWSRLFVSPRLSPPVTLSDHLQLFPLTSLVSAFLYSPLYQPLFVGVSVMTTCVFSPVFLCSPTWLSWIFRLITLLCCLWTLLVAVFCCCHVALFCLFSCTDLLLLFSPVILPCYTHQLCFVPYLLMLSLSL